MTDNVYAFFAPCGCVRELRDLSTMGRNAAARYAARRDWRLEIVPRHEAVSLYMRRHSCDLCSRTVMP